MFYLLGQEYTLVRLLLDNAMVGRRVAQTTVFGNRLERGQELNQIVMKLRRKLERYDITIDTVYGYGWGLSAPNKRRLRNLIERYSDGLPIRHTAKSREAAQQP